MNRHRNQDNLHTFV